VNIGEDTLDEIEVNDNREGLIECPKISLRPSTKMVCTKKGVAEADYYKNVATVTAKGRTSGKEVQDSDSTVYRTKFLLGSHFWADKI